MEMAFNVIVERDEEGLYVATVPEPCGCQTRSSLFGYVDEASEGRDRLIPWGAGTSYFIQPVCRGPAHHCEAMTRLPRVDGKTVVVPPPLVRA